MGNSRKKLPLILCVDVEPEARSVDRQRRSPWLGFEFVYEFLSEKRQRLQDATGRPVHYCWCPRIDPQVAETWGSPEWVTVHYAEYFSDLIAEGDEIGLHPHCYRWSQGEETWYVDDGNQDWINECIRMAYDGYERVFARQCETFRMGDGFMNTATMREIECGGARFDLTPEPGSTPSRAELFLERHTGVMPDCSDIPRHPYHPFARVTLWTNPYRMGPNNGHAYNVPKVVELFPQAPFYVFCDDDVLYHPGWLTRLVQTYHEAQQEGIEGIFTALNVPARPTSSTRLLPTGEVMLKRRQFALNWLVPAEIYRKVGPFRTTDIAFDTDYCQRLNEQGFWIVCLKPSYVQNIGLRGFYHSDNTHDIFYAQDYVGRVDLGVRLEQWQGSFRRWLGRIVDQIPPGFVRQILKSTRSPLRKP